MGTCAIRLKVGAWLLPLLILVACSGKGPTPCGSQTASIAFVKDLGKPNLDTLAKTGQGPRFFASAIVSYKNLPDGATGSQNLTGHCSGVVSFENPSDPTAVRLWTGEHCVVLGRTQELKVKLFYNGGYLEYPLVLPALEKDAQFRKKNASQDAKLVGLVSSSVQELDPSAAGFKNCQEDFGATKKQRGQGVSHICYTPHDLVTFAGNVASTPSAQHKEILDKLQKIYFEESWSCPWIVDIQNKEWVD